MARFKLILLVENHDFISIPDEGCLQVLRRPLADDEVPHVWGHNLWGAELHCKGWKKSPIRKGSLSLVSKTRKYGFHRLQIRNRILPNPAILPVCPVQRHRVEFMCKPRARLLRTRWCWKPATSTTRSRRPSTLPRSSSGTTQVPTRCIFVLYRICWPSFLCPVRAQRTSHVVRHTS